MDYATSRLWLMKVQHHTSRYLEAGIIASFSEVMGLLSPKQSASPMQYPAFGRGTDLYPGFCRLGIYRASPEWWHWCGLWSEWWTVRCIPILDAGISYIQVSGQGQTVLLRSDGNASTCGRSTTGQYIPSLRNNCWYICDRSIPVNATVRVLQL